MSGLGEGQGWNLAALAPGSGSGGREGGWRGWRGCKCHFFCQSCWFLLSVLLYLGGLMGITSGCCGGGSWGMGQGPLVRQPQVKFTAGDGP